MMKRIAIPILLFASLLGSTPVAGLTSPWVVRTFTYAWDNGEQVRDYRYRVAAYGPPPHGPVPLLVQLHEWVEGSASLQLRRPEEIVQYEDGTISFLMLYFEHAPAGVYPSPYYNWWWGDRIDGVPTGWTEERLMDRVRWVIDHIGEEEGFAGVSVDPQRVYLFGHSMGGTGTLRMGVKHPEVFAAIFGRSGFPEFVDTFLYEGMFVAMFGGRNEGLLTRGDDGGWYDAWQYNSVSWWLTEYKGPGFDPPFIFMLHGGSDAVVPYVNSAHLATRLDAGLYGFLFDYHPEYGHFDEVYVHLDRMLDLRRDQSYPAFSSSSANAGKSFQPGSLAGEVWNDRDELWWEPGTIVDQPAHYEIRLSAPSPVTVDVTLRRLQEFQVSPGGAYRYWTDLREGPGTAVRADAPGLLTIPGFSAPGTLIVEPAGPPEPCTRGPRTLCLNDGRFRVEVEWRDFQGNTGSGRVVPFAADDSGLFWFFAAENWEMLVKVLDGCGVNDRFWVFAAATTNVEYTLRVTDTATGNGKSYFNPLGNSAAAITDTTAFATCP